MIGSGPTNFHTNLWGLICLLGLLLLPLELDLMFPTSPVGWSAIFCNGLFYVVGYFLFFEGARRIGVTRASLITSVEPLFAALLPMSLFNQTLTALEWAEFFIVFVGLFYFENPELSQLFRRALSLVSKSFHKFRDMVLEAKEPMCCMWPTNKVVSVKVSHNSNVARCRICCSFCSIAFVGPTVA
jgi:hypothetical protein